MQALLQAAAVPPIAQRSIAQRQVRSFRVQRAVAGWRERALVHPAAEARRSCGTSERSKRRQRRRRRGPTPRPHTTCGWPSTTCGACCAALCWLLLCCAVLTCDVLPVLCWPVLCCPVLSCPCCGCAVRKRRHSPHNQRPPPTLLVSSHVCAGRRLRPQCMWPAACPPVSAAFPFGGWLQSAAADHPLANRPLPGLFTAQCLRLRGPRAAGRVLPAGPAAAERGLAAPHRPPLCARRGRGAAGGVVPVGCAALLPTCLLLAWRRLPCFQNASILLRQALPPMSHPSELSAPCSTQDNRVCVLAVPKAQPGEQWRCLFVGDSHGARCMQPPYTLMGARAGL